MSGELEQLQIADLAKQWPQLKPVHDLALARLGDMAIESQKELDARAKAKADAEAKAEAKRVAEAKAAAEKQAAEDKKAEEAKAAPKSIPAEAVQTQPAAPIERRD